MLWTHHARVKLCTMAMLSFTFSNVIPNGRSRHFSRIRMSRQRLVDDIGVRINANITFTKEYSPWHRLPPVCDPSSGPVTRNWQRCSSLAPRGSLACPTKTYRSQDILSTHIHSSVIYTHNHNSDNEEMGICLPTASPIPLSILPSCVHVRYEHLPVTLQTVCTSLR